MIHPTWTRFAILCCGLWPLLAAQAQDYKARALVGTIPKVCDTNNPCPTNVLVTRGEVTDPINGCTASWPFNSYDVKKGKQPRLVWEIVREPADRDVGSTPAMASS